MSTPAKFPAVFNSGGGVTKTQFTRAGEYAIYSYKAPLETKRWEVVWFPVVNGAEIYPFGPYLGNHLYLAKNKSDAIRRFGSWVKEKHGGPSTWSGPTITNPLQKIPFIP